LQDAYVYSEPNWTAVQIREFEVKMTYIPRTKVQVLDA